MDANAEVLKQIRESKRVGEYMLTSNVPSTNGVVNGVLGYGNNSASYASALNIDADSFLKNLHIKNSRSIVYNPIKDEIKFLPSFLQGPSVNFHNRERKSCNDSVSTVDITDRFHSINLKDAQRHISYERGFDSRHQDR